MQKSWRDITVAPTRLLKLKIFIKLQCFQIALGSEHVIIDYLIFIFPMITSWQFMAYATKDISVRIKGHSSVGLSCFQYMRFS